MIFRQFAKVSFIVAFLLFTIGCSNREPVNTMAETTAGPETATATVLVATSTAVLLTPTVTTAPTISATVTEVLATQIPEAASTSQAEMVPAEAILYSDTVITNIDNGIAYDQNGVVAARQDEHNGKMVWIPAIHEQMIAHSRDVFVAGDPGFSNINVYQYGAWEVRPGKPTTVEITTLDPERTAFFNQSVLQGLHSNPSLQVQDLSDPNRQEITLNQEQVQGIDTINLVITPFNQNQNSAKNVIPGITKINGSGRDHNWYGDSSIKSYWQTAWDETRPNELAIVLALSEAQIKETPWNVLNNIAKALQLLRIPSDVLEETPHAGTWVSSTDDTSYNSHISIIWENVQYHHDEDGKRVIDSWDNVPALEVKLNQ